MAMMDDLARQRDESRKRLLLLIAVFCLLALIVVVRLTYLQVVCAGDYRQQLDDWLVLGPDYVQPLRGDIRDRRGSVLAQDVPSWQVEAYYGVLDSRPTRSGRSRYVRSLARRLQRSGQYPADMDLDDVEETVHERIAESWQKLSDLSGEPTWELYKAADIIVERVQTIRQGVAQRQGFDLDVEEQRGFHPVLKDLAPELASRMRLELAGYPWLRVHTSTSRRYADDPAVCHLVGHLREVSREALRKDPDAGDELRRLQPGEYVGQDGIEYAAQDLLRGRRGKIVRNRDGECLVNIDPARGQDVHVTVDLDLQRWIYEQLDLAVHACPTASSAAAVVLDVNTREVKAMVSWPGYTQQDYTRRYEQLARDAVHRPLRLHAVADLYPAGSIVKPVTILAALNDGLTNPEETVNCTGYLYPNVRNAFRCWTTSRGIVGGHGPVNAQQAIMHSCNIYCYTMGRRLGVQRECEWFGTFGLGRSAGTELLEEATGRLPTPQYLADVHGHGRPLSQAELVAAAQNFAIGQADVLLTPLQAANLGATIATGFWRPVVLLVERADGRDDSGPGGRAGLRPLGGSSRSWRIVRDGMFEVVNDPAGTAYRYVRSEGVQIAGKTGTAETGPLTVGHVYELEMHDGSTRTLEVVSKSEAADKIAQMGESVVKWKYKGAKYWPGTSDPEHRPTHAWFMGFAPAHDPKVAVAVLIEYGGGGGQTAGPVARAIFEHIFGVESEHLPVAGRSEVGD
jgi:penicillin-binding protein 2